jgi:hypothetical protein
VLFEIGILVRKLFYLEEMVEVWRCLTSLKLAHLRWRCLHCLGKLLLAEPQKGLKKNLLESVEIKARSEFSSAFHGANRKGADTGRYVTDAVAWTVENLRVQGIREREIYFEQVFDPMRQAFLYNAWVKLEIPRGDYLSPTS